MPLPPVNRKAQTHQRIVGVAARSIRRNGYAGAGVAEVMREAGLTHGGFYAHFSSRDAMLAEAADRAGADGVAALSEIASNAPPGKGRDTLLRAYLSRTHVQRVEEGCPVAALGSELPRQTEGVRQAATLRIRELVDLVARQSPERGRQESHEQALATVATMVGALVIARAVDDSRLSDAVRFAALKHLGVTPKP
jgi:TetR/AcrR family transcriptional regulator, transcriptional repressor for nem operon